MAVPAEDIAILADRASACAYQSVASQPTPVEDQTHLRILGQAVLLRFDRAGDEAPWTALVPARSDDPHRYRTAIVLAAKTIFELLLDGHVAQRDWNAILKAAYPQWCDDPAQARGAMDQRLSRARRDVQTLLRAVVPRDDLVS